MAEVIFAIDVVNSTKANHNVIIKFRE